MYVTLPERRRRALNAFHAASASAMAELGTYAKAHGGRFLVFGSVARGDIAPTSDFDVVIDFPGGVEREARTFAEGVCRRHGITPDAHLLSETSEALLTRVSRDALVLA